MNISEFLISPIAGSVIGYFTNWLAIKMLFRPHEEKRIFGMKVPFTPGLIPKEKNRIAKKVGETVGKHLLSEEALVKALVDEKVLESLRSITANAFYSLRNNEESLDTILTEILGDHKNSTIDSIENTLSQFIFSKISDQQALDEITSLIMHPIKSILTRKVEDIPVENIIQSDFLQGDTFRQWIIGEIIELKDRIQNEERTMSEIIPDSWMIYVKEVIRDYFPGLVTLLIDYMNKPFIQQKLKQILLELIQANLGKLALMFVDADKIYDKTLRYIEESAQNEEKREEILKQINSFIDYVVEKPVKEWADKIQLAHHTSEIEDILNKVILYFTKEETLEKLKAMIKEYMSKQDLTVLTLITAIKPNIVQDMHQWIREYLENLIQKNEIFKKINLFISKEIKRSLEVPVSRWVKRIGKSLEEKIQDAVIKYYKLIITSKSSEIAALLDIPHIVEERIMDFETDYTEQIILSVVDRELKAITWLGGLLGFIIGFFPVLF